MRILYFLSCLGISISYFSGLYCVEDTVSVSCIMNSKNTEELLANLQNIGTRTDILLIVALKACALGCGGKFIRRVFNKIYENELVRRFRAENEDITTPSADIPDGAIEGEFLTSRSDGYNRVRSPNISTMDLTQLFRFHSDSLLFDAFYTQELAAIMEKARILVAADPITGIGTGTAVAKKFIDEARNFFDKNFVTRLLIVVKLNFPLNAKEVKDCFVQTMLGVIMNAAQATIFSLGY